MSKKVVVVCGATGNQGGAVVRALLQDGKYAIRGLTRDTTSPAAQGLAAQGVELVQGEPANKETVTKAFAGAYAVFGVTIPAFFPGSISELIQGKNLVDACKANNVPLFIWSSLPSVKQTSGGKYTAVTAFDEKAEVDEYIKQVGQPAVVFKTGGFISNLLNFHQLRQDTNNLDQWHVVYPWVSGTTEHYVTYVEKDLGPGVVAAINHWDDPEIRKELQKERIPLISFAISGEQKAAVISKVTGKQVDYIREEPTEGYNAMPALKEMYQFQEEKWLGLYPEGVPAPILLKLGVKFHSYEDYVREQVVPFMEQKH